MKQLLHAGVSAKQFDLLMKVFRQQQQQQQPKLKQIDKTNTLEQLDHVVPHQVCATCAALPALHHVCIVYCISSIQCVHGFGCPFARLDDGILHLFVSGGCMYVQKRMLTLQHVCCLKSCFRRCSAYLNRTTTSSVRFSSRTCLCAWSTRRRFQR